MKSNWFIVFGVAIVSLALGYFIGKSQTVPADTPQLGTKIPHDQAIRKIENYAAWAARNSYEHQACFTDEPNVEMMRLPAGWTFPQLSYDQITGEIVIDSARAYLGIDSLFYRNNNLENLELIMVKINEDGQDVIHETYSNLIRPCPQRCDFASELYEAYDNAYVSNFTPR